MDEAFKQLLGVGISGALNVLLLGCVAYLFKALQAERKEHAAEADALTQRYIAKSDKYADTILEQSRRNEAAFDQTRAIFEALAKRVGKTE